MHNLGMLRARSYDFLQSYHNAMKNTKSIKHYTNYLSWPVASSIGRGLYNDDYY